ncbi:MAG: FtsX-like permease family protein [Leifsonia sp.]
MGPLRLLAQRARAHAALLAAVSATIAIVVAALCGILGAVEAAAGDWVAGSLDDDSAVLEIDVPVPVDGEDAQRITDSVDALIADALGSRPVEPAATDGAREWRISATAADRTPERVSELRHDVQSLLARLDTAGIPGARFDVSGDLPATLARVSAGLAAARSITPLAVTTVLVFGAIGVMLLGGLLGHGRRTADELLVARGWSAPQRVSTSAMESVGLAAIAALIGWSIAVLVLSMIDGSPQTAFATWPAAAGTAGLAAVLLTLASTRPVGVRTRTGSARPRGGTAVIISAAVLAALGCALAIARLRSVTVGDPPDLIGGFAPLLTISTALLIGLACALPLVSAASAATARRRDLTLPLAVRSIDRRRSQFIVVAIVVGLSASTVVFAAGVSASWPRVATTSAELEIGADVRVAVPADRSAAALIETVRGVPGIDEAAPAVAAPLRLGRERAGMVALAPERASALLLDGGDSLDPSAIGHALETEPVGLPLDDADALRMTVDAQSAEGRGVVTITAWVIDADGDPTALDVGAVAVDAAPATLEAALPGGTAPWRLLGLDAELSAADGSGATDVTISQPVAVTSGTETPLEPATSTTTVSSLENHGRMPATAPSDSVVPGVFSSTLAERLGLAIGDRVEVHFDGSSREATFVVAGTSPAVPGTVDDLGIVAALPALEDALFQAGDLPAPATDLLLGAEDRTAGAAAVAAATDAAVVAAVPGRATQAAASSITGVWVSAIAGLVLAVIAIAAVVIAVGAARRGEVGLLRALGVPARTQARGRAVEFCLVTLGGLALGIVAGMIAVALTVQPVVAGAVIGRPVTLAPTIDLWSVIVVGGLGIAAMAMVVAAHVASVRRQAASAVPSGGDA